MRQFYAPDQSVRLRRVDRRHSRYPRCVHVLRYPERSVSVSHSSKHRSRTPRPRVFSGRARDGGARPGSALHHRLRHRRNVFRRRSRRAGSEASAVPDGPVVRSGRVRSDELRRDSAFSRGIRRHTARARVVERSVDPCLRCWPARGALRPRGVWTRVGSHF